MDARTTETYHLSNDEAGIDIHNESLKTKGAIKCLELLEAKYSLQSFCLNNTCMLDFTLTGKQSCSCDVSYVCSCVRPTVVY